MYKFAAMGVYGIRNPTFLNSHITKLIELVIEIWYAGGWVGL